MNRTPIHFLLAALVLALAIPAQATAQGPSRQTLSLTFEAQRTNASTATASRINFTNPSNASAKPFAVDEILLVFASGGRIDTNVPVRCSASNRALTDRGAAACPAASAVGGGVVRLDTGFAGPGRIRTADVTLINNTRQLIFLFEDRSSSMRLVTRGVVGTRTIRTPVPVLPGGPPDNQTAIDLSTLSTRRIANSRGSYVTTPPTCPASGAWTNVGSFLYDSLRQRETSRSPCRP